MRRILEKAIQFNPAEKIGSVNVCKKVSMDKLSTNTRKLSGFEESTFNGGAKFRNGDTLLAKITPCLENGKTAFVDILDDNEIACGSTEFIVMRAIEGVSDARYIYYFAKSPAFRKRAIGCMKGTSGRKRVDENLLRREVFDIPDIATQKAIAKVLSAIDDKIELNRRHNETLEALVNTIYEYHFVQNADARWAVLSLGEIGVEVVRGVTYGKDNLKTAQDATGILRATNISGNTIDLDNMVFVDSALVSREQMLNPFDIVITMSSGSKEHIGKNGFYCYNNKNIAFGAFCSKIKIGGDYKFYLYEYFQSQAFKAYVKNICLGTNINNLNNDHIKEVKIAFPPIANLQIFNGTAKLIFETIAHNTCEIEHLATLRDFLLPLLMNGQVTVGEAQVEVAKIIPFTPTKAATDKYALWKQDVGLAARGNIDEATLRNIYEAMDADDR
jgi:type I restriction enzyme S subunit